MLDEHSLPQHIAIIMDGNRRWAREKGKFALQGHEYVANEVIRTLVKKCIELHIPYLTLWAFSTENWNRDQLEVQGILKLFREGFSRSSAELDKLGVKLNSIGDLSRFPQDIQDNISQWSEKTINNQNILVTFALNYGGRDELTRAATKLIAKPGTKLEDHLDTAGLPDPDLIIRPGGEQRLSGFLPWQGVYSELYFTDVLMPDFDDQELVKAIEEFQRRTRRFGK